MTGDEDDPKLRHALDAYRVPDPPPDFADKLAARVQRPKTRRPWIFAVTALSGAVLILLVILARRPSHGAHQAAVRSTVTLAGRGVAVAEPGAEIDWVVDPGGETRVRQTEGDVFYRVEPGEAFVVETPLGRVEVQGTCFRVEVQPMRLSKQNLIAGGMGAVVAATVLVTVYEGRVRVVSPRGDGVTLTPGERARVKTGQAPVRETDAPARPPLASLPPVDPAATREQLLADSTLARRELEAANQRITHLESQLDEARDSTGEPKRVDPEKEELLAWAENCEVHIDAPDVFGAEPAKLGPLDVQEWGLTEAEAPAMKQALAALHARARVEMREIYLSVTGNTAGADELAAGAMMSEIFDKAVPADQVRARERLARERAGLQQPPADPNAQPAIERMFRLMSRLGDEMETELGKSLTPARARELRKLHNAWPGVRIDSGGCEVR